MATLKNGIMGGFSGRLGNLVVYELYGKTVVRTLPSVKQKKASGKRKQYQDDFRYVMKWMQIVKPMIDRCWPVKPPHKTPFKQAFSANLRSYREMERPESYEWLQVSQGTYPGLTGLSFTAEENSFKLSWDIPSTFVEIHPRDQVLIYFANAKEEEGCHQLFSVNRDQGSFEVALKYWTSSDPVIAFLVVLPSIHSGGLASETMCLSLNISSS